MKKFLALCLLLASAASAAAAFKKTATYFTAEVPDRKWTIAAMDEGTQMLVSPDSKLLYILRVIEGTGLTLEQAASAAVAECGAQDLHAADGGAVYEFTCLTGKDPTYARISAFQGNYYYLSVQGDYASPLAQSVLSSIRFK